MKNGIVRRMTALLLTMVCIITATPEALLTTYADEIQVLETEVLEETSSETEEAEYLEESENAKEETEYITEQSVATEIAEENQNVTQTETSTEEIKSTEQLETVTEKIESTEQLEESMQLETNAQETEVTEKEIISETEILSEAETESLSETIPEAEVILETESVSENVGIMLLSDEGETETTIDASYTDENGITYSYYAYEDGTANIYAVADYNGKDVAIPSEIDGYTVTQITAQFSYGAQLVSLTIPETVVSIGEYCFQVDGMGTLYYNATEAADIQSVYGAPFVGAAIGNLVIGENVRVIPKRMFYQAGFSQEELVLSVETIGINAFSYAGFKTLTIADGVKYLYGDAFESADIQQLNYCSNAESVESSSASGVFHSADIYALNIGENVTTLADYLFALSYLRFKELTVNVETIGIGTFH